MHIAADRHICVVLTCRTLHVDGIMRHRCVEVIGLEGVHIPLYSDL